MTLDDIAGKLGVSKSTVSRALSGKGRISEETRMKVRACAIEQGMYQEELPEPSRNLAVIIPADSYSVSIPFFQESLLGISEAAAMRNYSVQIVNGTVIDVSGIQKLVEGRRVDGFIFLRGVEEDRLMKYLETIRFPTGLIGTCKYEEVIQVDTDNREASESMTSLLIGQGYRRFAMAVGNITFRANQERCQGYFDALEKKGLAREQQLYYPNLVHMEMVDGTIGDMISGKVECIVCGDDVICARIMSRLQAEGYRIPRDISVASLYNSTYLECLSPAVTTVNISARKMGNMISSQLISRLSGETWQTKTILDYEILGRKSTGKLYQA